VLVGIAVFVALTCQWLAPFDPVAQFRQYTQAPPGTSIDPDDAAAHGGAVFWLGTDVNGRDILSRVLYGARISLLVGLIATLINVLIGLLVGVLAGLYGRWLDTVLMRITDTFFAFPGMLLAIIILATLNQPAVRDVLAGLGGKIDIGIWGLCIALGITGWTGIARVIRGTVLALKEQEFVSAARALGASQWRIIARHIVPNCLAPLIVLGTMQIAYNILSEAGLSFLGLGVQPPRASWGGMLSEGRAFMETSWWWGVFPGIALALTILGFNLFGDGLRDVLDPRQTERE
jgi:peptide/nickel transport system permease protein